MASERKEDLKNMKVLTSKATGVTYHSKKEDRKVTEYEVLLQSVDDSAVVITGYVGDPAPEVGDTLERVIVYEDKYKDKIKNKFLIPTQQAESASGNTGQQTSSKGAWTGGKQEDVELKLVSFAMSYAKDLFASTPDAKLEGMFDTADAIFKKMSQMYKEAKS